MAEQIRDGKGSGYLAAVNKYNRLQILAISSSLEHWTNHSLQDAYHLLFDVTPAGAGDCFLYIKNTSSTDMVIEGIDFSVASAEQVEVYLKQTGTPAGGATATPVNLNTNTSKQATGTFQTANDITGLSGGAVAQKLWLTDAETVHFNFDQDIIIGTNTTFCLYAVTGGINVRGTVIFNYHENEDA